MTRAARRLSVLATVLSLILALLATSVGRANSPANEYFDQTWQRTDKPVTELQTSRTWMWGPEAFTGELSEAYAGVPSGERRVQYFDKSRMEIASDPNVLPNSPWYVTNGLLVKELITGQLQVGDETFEVHSPADINVAGDPLDAIGPTYTTFGNLLDASALPDGATIIHRVDRAGNVSDDSTMEVHGVTAAYRVTVEGIDHQIASPFWEFMNSSGLVWIDEQYHEALLFPNAFYATGYPITEAYWSTVKVADEYMDVLIQCFERRCLTYTPDNEPGWQVEAGNVGRHYYAWRYNQIPEQDQEPQSPTVPNETATQDPTEVPSEPQSPQLPTVTPAMTPVPTDPPSDVSPTATPVATEVDTVYVTDSDNRVVKFGSNGTYVSEWGSKGTSDGRFNLPHGIAVDSSENVYVVDYGNHRVQKFDPEGNFLLEIGGEGNGKGKFTRPVAVAIDTDGSIYVADRSNALVQKFSSSGKFLLQWGGYGSTDGRFDAIGGIAVDLEGAVYVVDEGGNRVQKFDSNGNFLIKWGSFGDRSGEFDRPHSLAVSKNGDVYVGDIGNSRVQRFSSDGQFIGEWGRMGSELGEFHSPYGIAVDDRGDVFVLDYGYARIQVFSPSGTYKRHWGGYDEGEAQLQSPWGIALAINPAGGSQSHPPSPTSTPSPTATPIPPTEVPTVPPLSNAYLFPEGAVLSVLEELCDCEVSTSHPGVQVLIESAYTFRHQYHLATAPVGSFNRDTTNFYSWLTEILNREHDEDAFNAHLDAQARTAIYNADSAIGIQIRLLEANMDPLLAGFALGPEAYYVYLIDPVASKLRYPNLTYDVVRSNFNEHVLDYQAAIASDPSFDLGFGDYLASIGYNMLGLLEP